jgi:acetylornithine deacetylase/succinyl-diaminopimelate desuccinylase-like protein
VDATGMTVLELLDALVRIDSVNPGLDPAGGGEAELASYVAQWGGSAGLAAALIAGRDANLTGVDGEITVAAVADEELASIGIQDVMAHLGEDGPVSAGPWSPSPPNGRWAWPTAGSPGPR